MKKFVSSKTTLIFFTRTFQFWTTKTAAEPLCKKLWKLFFFTIGKIKTFHCRENFGHFSESKILKAYSRKCSRKLLRKCLQHFKICISYFLSTVTLHVLVKLVGIREVLVSLFFNNLFRDYNIILIQAILY